MSDPTQKFLKHYQVPKSEIKKIRKEYESAKEASSKIDPDKFKDFKEMADEVFDYFEEISGKKTNRDVMIGHLSYYFDEGYAPKDMKPHISKQISEECF